MSFFDNKNYPFFNHKDTFLLKSPKPKDFLKICEENSMKKSCCTPKINLLHRFFQSPKPEEEKIEFFPKIFRKKPSFSVEKIVDKTQKFSLHFPKKTQISLIKTEVFDEKTQDFLQYLSFLRSFHAKPKEKLGKPLISSINPKKPLDFQSNLKKKLNEIQRKKKVAKTAFIEENPKIATYNSLISSKMNSLSFIGKKRGSMSIDSNSRLLRVKNYTELQEIVIKVSKNLINLIKIVSNERKAVKIISEMFENKTKYLKKLFFIEEKDVFLENLSISSIENACFSKGSSFNVINNSQIYEERLISSNITQDLCAFNDKIEGYLCERNVKEIRILAEDFMCKLNKNPDNEENYNYENMPDHSVIDDVIFLKNQYGNSMNFDKKQIIIGKTIDEIIRNVKYNPRKNGVFFNVIEN